MHSKCNLRSRIKEKVQSTKTLINSINGKSIKSIDIFIKDVTFFFGYVLERNHKLGTSI